MEKSHEIVLYQSDGANVCVNVVFFDDTFWLSQRAMAELFEVNPQAITKHLENIYSEWRVVKSGNLFQNGTSSN